MDTMDAMDQGEPQDAHQPSEAQIAELRAENARLAAVCNTGWEPRVVTLAFARQHSSRIKFTLQTWIDLEAVESPLLRSEIPSDYDTAVDVMADALQAFEQPPIERAMEPEELLRAMRAMVQLIENAWAMNVPMQEPTPQGGAPSGPTRDPGTGRWLALYSCLVAQLGIAPDVALRMEVAKAYALVVGHRGNTGRVPTGISYAQMDALVTTPDVQEESVTTEDEIHG